MIQTKPNGWHKLAFQDVIQIYLINSSQFGKILLLFNKIERNIVYGHTILHSQGQVKQTWINNYQCTDVSNQS